MKETIELTGAIVLTPHFKNRLDKIKIRCKNCFNIYEQSFFVFDRKQSGLCPSCSQKENHHKTLTFEYVKNTIKKDGNELLTDFYENVHQLLKIKCSCGNVYNMSFLIYNRKNSHRRCPNCVKKTKDKERSLCFEERLTDILYPSLLFGKYKTLQKPVLINCSCGEEFYRRPDNIINRKDNLCRKCSGYNGSSKQEYSLQQFIKSICNDQVFYNYRKLISPLELDVYIPSKNIAIAVFIGILNLMEKVKTIILIKHKCVKKKASS